MRGRKTAAIFLSAALIFGCSAKEDVSVVSAKCDGPAWDQFPKGAAKMTMDQWNSNRFSCIQHFARFYANGRDSADAIAEVVTQFDCAMPVRMMAEAAARDGDQSNDQASIEKATRLTAMQEVLMSRASACPTEGRHHSD